MAPLMLQEPTSQGSCNRSEALPFFPGVIAFLSCPSLNHLEGVGFPLPLSACLGLPLSTLLQPGVASILLSPEVIMVVVSAEI